MESGDFPWYVNGDIAEYASNYNQMLDHVPISTPNWGMVTMNRGWYTKYVWMSTNGGMTIAHTMFWPWHICQLKMGASHDIIGHIMN